MPPRTIRRGELYWLDPERIAQSSRRAILPPAPSEATGTSDTGRASVIHPVLIVHSSAFEGRWNFGIGVVVATLEEREREKYTRKGWCTILESHEVAIDHTTTEPSRPRVAKCKWRRSGDGWGEQMRTEVGRAP